MFRPLIILLVVHANIATAQNANFIGSWTNGNEFYYSQQLNDSTIQFEGGSLHEGGSAFMIRSKKDGKWYIAGSRADEFESPSLGNNGDCVEYKNMNGIDIILIKQDCDQVMECLRKMREDETLEKVAFSNKVNYELAGRYVNTQTKKQVIFFAGIQEVEGLTTARKYQFETEYDYPADVITFANKKSFYYEVKEDGLDIFNCEEVEGEGVWIKKEKIMSLRKTEWFNFSGDTALKGKYPFASTLVLIDDILGCFSLTQLQLMRNEIYARHGYIFKSPAISAYFKQQDWYKGISADVNDQLTELERLNIRLILRMEDKKSRN